MLKVNNELYTKSKMWNQSKFHNKNNITGIVLESLLLTLNEF